MPKLQNNYEGKERGEKRMSVSSSHMRLTASSYLATELSDRTRKLWEIHSVGTLKEEAWEWGETRKINSFLNMKAKKKKKSNQDYQTMNYVKRIQSIQFLKGQT